MNMNIFPMGSKNISSGSSLKKEEFPMELVTKNMNNWFPVGKLWRSKKCLVSLKPMLNISVHKQFHQMAFMKVMDEMMIYHQKKIEKQKETEEKIRIESLDKEAWDREERWNCWQEEWREQEEKNFYSMMEQLDVKMVKRKEILPKILFGGFYFSSLNKTATLLPTENQLIFETAKKVLNWDWRCTFNIVLDEMSKQFRDKRLLEVLRQYRTSHVTPIKISSHDKKEIDESVDILLPIEVTFEEKSEKDKKRKNREMDKVEEGYTQVVYKRKRREMDNLKSFCDNKGIILKSKTEKKKTTKTSSKPLSYVSWLQMSEEDKKKVNRITEEKESDIEIEVTYSKKELTDEEKSFQKQREAELKEQAIKKNEKNRLVHQKRSEKKCLERDNLKKAESERKKTWSKITGACNQTKCVKEEMKPMITIIMPQIKSNEEEKIRLIPRKMAPWINLIETKKPQIEVEIKIPEIKTIKKEVLQDKNCGGKCTQVCKFVSCGKKCYKDNCNFAHSIKNFNPVACHYSSRCKRSDCYYIHPSQTKEELWDKLVKN